MSNEKQTGAAYLDDDGRTVYTLDGRGGRVDVGEITGRTPSGYEVTAFAPLTSIAGAVRQVPRVESVAEAEALFGRGAAVIHARGGVAECLAAEAPPVVAVAASRAVVDNRPPPVDLAAENAALRDALAASGELLAEAHAEVERLRGAR